MNILRIAVTLFTLTALFPGYGTAKSYSFEELEKEAHTFHTKLLGNKGKNIGSVKNNLIRTTAGVLKDAGECRTALSLYEKAVTLGHKSDFALWQAMAGSAACCNEWQTASNAALLALENAEKRQEKIAALKKLGHALEQREEYSDNWQPAALYAYRQLLVLEYSKETVAKIEELTAKKTKRVSIRKAYSKNRGEKPAICIEFTQAVSGDIKVNFADYIRITPEISSEFFRDSGNVCIGNAGYGVEYSIKVLQGMPISKDIILEHNDEIKITAKHRAPALWFDQNAYILPRSSSSGIGFRTINVKKANLRLYRIHERNILHDFVRSKFNRKLDARELEEIKEQKGALVWQGSAEIKGERDKQQTNTIVLPEKITDTPGLYILVAENSEEEYGRWDERTSQWLVVSDTGLTTYINEGGMSVVARSLATAGPLAGIKLTLLARNNTPLAVTRSDSKGLARFPAEFFGEKDGMKPALLIAEDERSGFSFLRLDTPPFDLSEYGVGGRRVP
ncbi:MAG: hypothetical protein CSB24_06145, partial [Deltaproteobacteria bacterium]